jgi:hypothetical protein
MFRQISDSDFEEMSAGGVRHLARIDHFRLQDVLDDGGELRHCLLELNEEGEEQAAFLADQPTMYEFLARYLAGEWEKREYRLTRSPAHDTLLDMLEMATARARAGDTDFVVDDLVEDEEEFGVEEFEVGEEEAEEGGR